MARRFAIAALFAVCSFLAGRRALAFVSPSAGRPHHRLLPQPHIRPFLPSAVVASAAPPPRGSGAIIPAVHQRTRIQVSLSEDAERDELSLVITPTKDDNFVQQQTQHDAEESWVDESKHIELAGLSAWMVSTSTFILVNNFIGPWPASMSHVPERVWFLGHMIGGMLFGGGVLLTTAIEYMVAINNSPLVLQFWFDKVPLLDMAIVLPGLTLAMVSGTGLAIEHYGSLGDAPPHIANVFWALVVFAAWWAATDLTTQGGALNAVMEYTASDSEADKDQEEESMAAPDIIHHRTISNVVSCFLVLVVYSIMVLKPGTIHYW